MNTIFPFDKKLKTINLVKSTTFFSINPEVENRQAHDQRVRELASIKERLKIWNKKKKKDKLFQSQTLSLKRDKVQFLKNNTVQGIAKETRILNMSQFIMGELIGRGASGTAKMAIHKDTKAVFCIKTICRDKVEQNLDKFIQSIKIQMFMNHPNVAKIYALIVQKKHVHIVMEYCNDGDLTFNLYDIRNEGDKGKQILLGISKGVKYLHDKRIHHRDLKLQNILLTFGTPKITDFELAVYTKTNFFPRKTICGSPAYFSPQMIVNQKYNKKADIWCLGIIFYEILCGYFPFLLQNNRETGKIAFGQMKDIPRNVREEGKELIVSMLQKEWEKRINIQEVLVHRFFNGR